MQVQVLLSAPQSTFFDKRMSILLIHYSIKINRKVVNGKQLNSASIENKMIVEELFGIAGTERKSTKYNVEKDAENILMIYGE